MFEMRSEKLGRINSIKIGPTIESILQTLKRNEETKSSFSKTNPQLHHLLWLPLGKDKRNKRFLTLVRNNELIKYSGSKIKWKNIYNYVI